MSFKYSNILFKTLQLIIAHLFPENTELLQKGRQMETNLSWFLQTYYKKKCFITHVELCPDV